MKRLAYALIISIGLMVLGCRTKDVVRVKDELSYCSAQAEKTLIAIPADTVVPRNVEMGTRKWKFVTPEDWTSGFWPGILWYLYEGTGDKKWRAEADKYTRYLTRLSQRPAQDHDLGFQVFSSFGNGYRLTNDSSYKEVILRTADTLATLFNPKVGTILSWPGMVREKGWPHNTIIDNLMNLELLFWASKNGPNKNLYGVALRHAETTMVNHFHDDIAYHVVLYDTVTGKKIASHTHQGYNDTSMWARGQSWAIYGYTMIYRETGEEKFREKAVRVADVFLSALPEDYVPYWDFNAVGGNEPKDASAAAITASALVELSGYIEEPRRTSYLHAAQRIVSTLSSRKYASGATNSSFLLHSTGHKPNGTEIDASIIYADYYYLEALIRLQNLQKRI